MQQVQREEFTGPSPALSVAEVTAADGRTSIWKGVAMIGFVFVIVVFFGPGESVAALTLPALVVLYGVFNLVGGLLAVRKAGADIARLAAGPAPEDVTWYVLDGEGLVVLADGRLDRGPAGLTIPWSALRTVTPVEGDNGTVHLTYRLPKALSPEGIRLPADRRRADGVPFGTRLKTLFEARSATVTGAA